MHKFTTIIDVIDRGLGTKLSSRVLTRRRGLDFDARKRIATEFDKYEHEVDKFVVPQKHPAEIFPYVHPRWLVAGDLGARGYNVAIDSEILNIKSLLLYYHKIALPDGFGYVCDFYRLGDDSNQELDIRFDSYLKFFLDLRPLIQNGTVFFMPEVPTYFPAREAVEKLETPDWLDDVDDKDSNLLILRRLFEESLWIGSKFDLDLLIPGSHASETFEQYMRYTSRSISETKLQESTIGSVLLECQLPRLEKLSVTDIAAIRNDSDGFAAWRASLRSILTAFYDDSSHANFDQTEFERYAREEMAQGKIRIEKEISKSQYLGLLKTGLKSVGVGTATALLVAPIAPAAQITAAIAGASTSFFLEYLLAKSNWKENRRLEALKTHYAIFSPEEVK